MMIGIFKEWLVKHFFVHKIVFKAILVFEYTLDCLETFAVSKMVSSVFVKTGPIYRMETNINIRKWLVLTFHGSGHLPNHTTSK
jgi:hypothetical protein